ncbi:MAG: RecX family transcriptional regulator [Bacilli bacterium]
MNEPSHVTITRIAIQTKNETRANIYTENGYLLSASIYAITRLGIKANTSVDPEQLRELVFIDDIERARTYVGTYLLHATTHQITVKLGQKGYEADVIEDVLRWCDTYKIVDDADYARRYTNDRLRLHHDGPARIRERLREKGIHRKHIDVAIAALLDEEIVEHATIALRKCIRRNGHLPEAKQKQKTCQQLAAKGYYYAQFLQAWTRIQEEEEA